MLYDLYFLFVNGYCGYSKNINGKYIFFSEF